MKALLGEVGDSAKRTNVSRRSIEMYPGDHACLNVDYNSAPVEPILVSSIEVTCCDIAHGGAPASRRAPSLPPNKRYTRTRRLFVEMRCASTSACIRHVNVSRGPCLLGKLSFAHVPSQT
ncbi:unnamed protein product [Scytosiphon promiscuus]